LQRRNLLLAMRKSQEAPSDKDEISPAEELTMKTLQYKKVVKQQREREKTNVANLKRLVLDDSNREEPKTVDIGKLLNKDSAN
jgi:hypothetical protein